MRRKIVFLLEPDDDGYPPVRAEGIWAIQREGALYEIDNIPFFATKATLGDLVSVREDSGELLFVETVERSENSLIRVAYSKRLGIDPQRIRDELDKLGCESELDDIHGLIAVNIPLSADLEMIQAFLEKESARDGIDYEEPILRQRPR